MRNWPLVLPHADVRRILDRKASRFLVTRQIKPGTYDVQDALIVRRNERHQRNGHWEDQQDPSVFAITVTDIGETTLGDLDYQTIRALGFKTQRDFYDDWLERRKAIDPGETVRLCSFAFTEPGRFLHAKVHRGYTTDPARSARGEPQALTAAELKELAGANQRRYDREHREELTRQRARSLQAQIREAERLEDWDAAARLGEQLTQLYRNRAA